MNSVRRQTDGLNLHGRLSAFPISRMHTSNGTDNKRRQFRHKSRPQILPRLRQFGRAPPSGYIRGRFVHARILFSPLPSSFFFYFLFSLSFHFTLRQHFSHFPLSFSFSLYPLPPSTDGLIQRGELNKQKVRLPGPSFSTGERKYL